MESIHDIHQKIKSREALPYLLIILVCIAIGLACFALGRASYKAEITNHAATGITIEYPPLVGSQDEPVGVGSQIQTTEPSQNTGVQLVGSKNGTKYYKTTCAGVERINEENKVYFSTIDEAQGAGYEPAVNCF